MKKFLLLLFFSYSINGFSQNYKPIVNEANNWSVLSAGLGVYLKVCGGITNHYKFLGDTIINGNDYKKVFCSQDSLKQNWVLYGFIRENVSTKKVWLRNLKNNEGLIYDFDVVVGSRIGIFNPISDYETDTCYIIAIDSVLIQSEYRKRYKSIHNVEWIEGIGSKFGIFDSTVPPPGGFSELLCFSDNHISYTNPKYQTCYKSKFTPTILCKSLDRAVLNKPYYFKIPTTEIFGFDSVSFSVSRLSSGLVLNKTTGEISGVPTTSGEFPIIIYVWNNGHLTDYLNTNLIVDSNSANIEHESESGFSISPNPTTGFLSINCSSNYNEFAILIYNSVGEMVISKIMNPNEKLDIRSLSSGVYVVRIMDKQKANILFLGKLINEK